MTGGLSQSTIYTRQKITIVDWLEPDAWLTGGWLTGDWWLVDWWLVGWSTGGWLVGRLVVGGLRFS